ncbi:MAG: transposase family protein [bacterium]
MEEFQTLADKLRPEWKEREYNRLNQRMDRKNKVGQGRKYGLKTFENLLLLTLLYLRTTIGQDLLGLIFGIDPSTVRRVIKRMMPLLTDRFIPKTEITKWKRRTNNLDEFLKDYPELKDIIVDGTELPINRPKKGQKKSYSGKKKRHTKKSQIIINKKDKLILGISPPEKGKIHDKKQFEKTGWDKKLPKQVNRYADMGYTGTEGDNWNIPKRRPPKGKLTRKEKLKNKKISKERIFVEHSIRGIKMFRRIGETITIKSDNFLFNTIFASANLNNFKILMRHEQC